MPWKPETFDVDLLAAGYTTTEAVVTVLINPPTSLVRDFEMAISMLSVGDGAESAANQQRFYELLSRLVVSIRRGAEVDMLNTPEALRQFENTDDWQLVAFGMSGLWQEKARRRATAEEHFRARDWASLVRAGGPGAATG
jgi:hypothetical protein